MPTVTVKIKLPDYNRQAFTDLLIAGKKIVPFHNYALLIDHDFFYSHDSDVEAALDERFDQEWRKREYASAVSEAEQLRKYFLEEEKLDKIPYGCDADSIFKRRFNIDSCSGYYSVSAEVSNVFKSTVFISSKCAFMLASFHRGHR